MTLGSRPVFLCFGRIEQCAFDLVPPDRQNLAACTLFLLKLHISVSGLASTRIVCSGSFPFPIFRLRGLFQTLSQGAIIQQTRCCFHACFMGHCFLQQHPAHVMSSSTLPWRTSVVPKKHMCTGLILVAEFGVFFLGLLVQADGPLFSLKWDRPQCFPPSTFCTAGRLIDTLCTCFLLLICSHAYYTSHYISLFPFILYLSLRVCQKVLLAVPQLVWQVIISRLAPVAGLRAIKATTICYCQSPPAFITGGLPYCI